MDPFLRSFLLFLIGSFFLGIVGCASYEPKSMDRTGPPSGTVNERGKPEQRFSSDRERKSPDTTDSPGKTLSDLRKRDYVNVERNDGFIILTLKSRILFDLGSARINGEAWPVLDEVAKYLSTKDEHWILVAGHTDDLPTRTQEFPSNWDLSAQRSVNVIKYISNLKTLDPSSLIAAGMAEHHPIASNQTEEGRKQNRRLEIFILKDNFPAQEYRKQ